MKSLTKFLAAFLLVVFTSLLARPVYAASATMYLSPASGSVAQGSYLSVSIRENSGGDQVNAAKAVLTYPANLLDFVSISSSSAFSVVAANSGGSGSVNVERGALPAVSGDQLVATVRFKAKVSSGTASIAIAGGSQVLAAADNANVLAGTSGGNYTLTSPPPPPPAAPPPDTTPPAIKSVIAASSSITTKSAVISWTTSEPSSSEVDYGVNNGYGLVAVDGSYVTDHKITLSSAILSPGVLYHFMVKSTDPAGNTMSGPDFTFTTKGANLLVTVVNQNNKLVSGAKVTFGSHSAVTDKKGQATVQNLTLGNHTGTVTYKGKQNVVSVQVANIAANGRPQAVTLKINTPRDYKWLIVGAAIIVLLLLAAVISRRGGGSGPLSTIRNRFTRLKKTGSDQSQESVVNPPAASSVYQPTTGSVIITPDNKSTG